MRPSSRSNKLRSTRTPQKINRIWTTQQLTQNSDPKDEEGAEAAGDKAAKLPQSRAEEISNPKEPIPGPILLTTPVSTTCIVMDSLPTQMPSLVSMTTSKKMNPLATGPSDQEERKIPRKARI